MSGEWSSGTTRHSRPPTCGFSSGGPVAEADADSGPFWDACTRGELVGQRCLGCRRWRAPAEFCPHCHTRAHEWLPLPGTGVLRSCVVVHRAQHPAFADRTPYRIARVELDRGFVLTCAVDGEPRIGHVVEIVFRDNLPHCRETGGN
ncbi:Zn-ribbon domain-containing OB-fold protein [Pseudonocardia spinosispora]|uniref:Zn-ribbon domain-containing OB-fold protein n=1 Tax=Pseudonocardia spinosispora TaxID=103441 RepID=UPI000401034F|nr:OB-fold domain-containing protein [Pseudonocardia spinosispora]